MIRGLKNTAEYRVHERFWRGVLKAVEERRRFITMSVRCEKKHVLKVLTGENIQNMQFSRNEIPLK